MKTVYYLIVNGGDGSADVVWFTEKPDLESMEEEDPEAWYLNEGVIGSLPLPDNYDLSNITKYWN